MPLYNGARYIRDTIASIVAQTVQPSELFVIDDGSADGSADIAAEVQTPFPKYILHQKSKRQSAARNLAAAKAVGKYLAFIDHDDLWYPRHLELLVEPLDADSRYGWSYSDIDEIDSDGALVGRSVLRSLNLAVEHPKTNIFNMLANDMFIFPSAAVVRRDAFVTIGGFDERLSGYEDDDLFLRMFRAGWLNEYIPEPLVRYRRHPLSSAFSERMWISRDIFARKLIDAYPDDRELVRFYVRDIIAPRFYSAARAEYIRHFPLGRWDQCVQSVALMRRFHKMMRLPPGRKRVKQSISHLVLASPRVFSILYPLLRFIRPMPRFW
jgi:glycosyltransferase involved in cell wall biosynthesis